MKTRTRKEPYKTLSIAPTLKDCLDIIARNESCTLHDLVNDIMKEYCNAYIKSRCKLDIYSFIEANKVNFN